MIEIKKNQATASLRRIFFHLVDATDGMTPKTGETGGQPQISIAGGTWANTTNTLVAIGNGRYYVELTQAETNQNDNTVIESRYKSAYTAEAVGTTVQIITYQNGGLSTLTAAQVNTEVDAALAEYDPPTKAELDAAQSAIQADAAVIDGNVDSIKATVDANLDATVSSRSTLTAQQVWEYGTRTLTNFGTLVADIATAVWSALTSGLTTVGSIGKLIADYLDAAVSTRATPADITGTLLPGVLQPSPCISSSTRQTIVRGDVATLRFNLGAAWNLTGKKAYFAAKADPAADNNSAIVNAECSVTDAATGQCEITLTPEQTAVVGLFHAEVGVRNTDESGQRTALQFPLAIIQDVRQ